MVILGAGGHAVELLDILIKDQSFKDPILFFDNVTPDLPDLLYEEFQIIKTADKLADILEVNPHFAIGVSGPKNRQSLMQLALKLGGEPRSLISTSAMIGSKNIKLDRGLNVMHYVIISNNCQIGEGCLINARTTIHHDSYLGDYTEIGPGCTITGKVIIGNECIIGAGVTILPGVELGDRCIVGAGAVVTKDVQSDTTVVGVPAKPI